MPCPWKVKPRVLVGEIGGRTTFGDPPQGWIMRSRFRSYSCSERPDQHARHRRTPAMPACLPTMPMCPRLLRLLVARCVPVKRPLRSPLLQHWTNTAAMPPYSYLPSAYALAALRVGSSRTRVTRVPCLPIINFICAWPLCSSGCTLPNPCAGLASHWGRTSLPIARA
jgi:hypothetical protein